MAKAVTIVGGVFKFVGALAVGLVFLTVVQILVLLAAPRISGLVLPFGSLAVLVLSARFAVGKPGGMERAVGVAAAGATAAVAYTVGMIAAGICLFAVFGLLLLQAPQLLHPFAPTGIKLLVILRGFHPRRGRFDHRRHSHLESLIPLWTPRCRR
jgi:hypothetical protein